MATYVTLYQFTDQGIRNVKDSPPRFQKAVRAAEEKGGKVIAAYYTEGPYDLVTIAEWDDERTAAAFALSIGAQGNVRSTTLRAHTPEEFADIVDGMP